MEHSSRSYQLAAYRLIACVFGLLLASCQFQKDPDKDKVPAEEVKGFIDEVQRQQDENIAAAISSTDILTTFTPLPQHHQYEMTISWPKTIPFVMLQHGPLQTLKKGSDSFSTVISSDMPQSEVILETKNSQGHTISKVTLLPQPPKDIVVSKVAQTGDLEIHANRIFIDSTTPIATNGFNLSIKADQIIVSNPAWISTVETWSEVHYSSDSRLISGGSISIQARKILGHLTLYLYGVNGTQGRDGALLESIANVPTPKNGAPGAAGGNKVEVLGCMQNPSYNSDVRYLKNAEVLKCRSESVTHCSPAPTNGGKGEDAPKAMDGENGGDGGNTPNVFINVEELETGITIRRKVGKGGTGGKAAPPRQGGRGGAAGAPDPKALCPAAAPGADGANGSAGRDGSPGKNGQMGTLSLPTGEAFRYKIHVFDE